MIHGDEGWLGWCSTVEGAHVAADAAMQAGASGVIVHAGEPGSVVRVQGLGDHDGWAEACDVALYRTATRHVLRHVRRWPLGEVTPGVTMLFSIHRKPGMSVHDFHAWWERSHAPVALRHHVGMWDYAQVSVVETVHGTPWDGFAVTQWPTLDDLMHRFSSGPEGTAALRDDAAQFTDATTLQRALMDETVLVETAWPASGVVPVGAARSAPCAVHGPIGVDDLPDGVSAEVRPTAEGGHRLDVLWRSVVDVTEVDALPGRFDVAWSRLAAAAGVDPQLSSNS
jgi:hypothetical protein